jgi:hypothetical protein
MQVLRQNDLHAWYGRFLERLGAVALPAAARAAV